MISGDYRSRMDLSSSRGTIARPMSAPRWLCVLAVAALIALAAPRAQAQVFRPRTGKAAVVAKAAAAPAAASTVAARKTGAAAATPAATPAKKSTRPAGTARRPGKKHGKKHGDSDTVVIDDDDDDDVKITDD